MAGTKHRVTVSLDEEDFLELTNLTLSSGRSMSWFLIFALRKLVADSRTRHRRSLKQWMTEQVLVEEV